MRRKKRLMALALAAVIALAQTGSVLAEELVIAEAGAEDSERISTEELEAVAQDVQEMADLMLGGDAAQDTGAEQDAGAAQDSDVVWDSDAAQDAGVLQDADIVHDSGQFSSDTDASDGASADNGMEQYEPVSDGLTEPEDAADGQAAVSDELGEVADGAFILDVEELAAPEGETEPPAAEIPADFPEVFEGQASESGQAVNASLPGLRAFSMSSAVFENSYGQQLSGNAKGLYDAMVTKYVNGRGTGDMTTTFLQEYSYDTTEAAEEVGLEIDYAVQSAYDAFKYDYPEVFWMSAPRYQSVPQHRLVNGEYVGYVSTFKLFPGEVYENAASEIAAFDSAVNSAVSQISALSSGMSMYDKVKLIHDIVCTAAIYPDPDTNGVNIKEYSYSPSGLFLKDGYVVCEGYAKSIKILCNRLGIDCVLIVGNAGGGHMWNYVKMDNSNWYLVDATWDDQDSWNTILYSYFLVGSGSMGLNDKKICDERQIYTNFSGSTYTMDFAVPVLSTDAYDKEAPLHVHTWVEKERVNPTCMAGGYAVNECSTCGAVTRETFDKTEHSYQKKIAVYNNDATCLKDGTQTIYCDYGCGTADRTVTVKGTKLQPTISVNVSSIRLKKGQSTKKVKISGLGPGDYVESWTSSSVKKVRVTGDKNGNCKITAGKKTGKATIEVNLKSGLSKKITVNVQSGTVKTTKLSGLPKSITLQKGSTNKLSPVISPITSGQKVRYSSSNKKVATVSSKGVIRARKAGKAKITVSSGSKKVRVTVRVTK